MAVGRREMPLDQGWRTFFMALAEIVHKSEEILSRAQLNFEQQTIRSLSLPQ
jgi:hypothetical protein